MTKRVSTTAFAVMLSLTLPAAALAQRGGGRPAPAPAPRAAAPAQRAAAPVARPAQAAPGGFNLRRDTAPAPAAPAARVAPPAQQRAATTSRTAEPAGRRPSFTANTTGGPYHGRFTGPTLRNGRVGGGNYGWNHGVAWQPAPIYWGGGFWGPFAIASLGGLAAYGAFDGSDQVVYPSYEVAPDTPGAELLDDYGLQQTECGPPDLVVIWGPDNSVICAIPNAQVGPGDYEVDPATFTLIAASPQ